MEFKDQSAEMEELWIESASNGDLDAFNQLVLKHQDAAYYHALAMLNDEWLAEEVTQDAFLKAFQNVRGFRGGSFRAWLMRIVTNTAYDWLRQSARRPTQPLFPKDEHGEEMETPFWIADRVHWWRMRLNKMKIMSFFIVISMSFRVFIWMSLH